MITALYSDQVISENARMDSRLAALIKARGTRLGYISSGPDPERTFFEKKRQYYERYGLSLDLFVDLDQISGIDLAQLFSCNAIHLSGGHTNSFLKRLHQSGIFVTLREWALNDGILIGTSAGAILMTPIITVDSFFSGSLPKGVGDGAGLNLLPFEFFPHLNCDPAYLPALLSYSQLTCNPIVACRDGEGLILGNGLIEVFGAPLMISDGRAETLDSARLGGIVPSA